MMVTDFAITSSENILPAYRWDDGLPFPYTAGSVTGLELSGYAPHLKVFVENQSTPGVLDPSGTLEYVWDFGDYYNIGTNTVRASALDSQSHVYIMPGIYAVTLTQNFSMQLSSGTIPPGYIPCQEHHCKTWSWDGVIPDNVTWDDTKLGASLEKTWNYQAIQPDEECYSPTQLACFQKHCVPWSWRELKMGGNYEVTWSMTKTDREYVKKWKYESPENCSNNGFTLTTSTTSVPIAKGVITILEVSPKALLNTAAISLTGIAPYTVEISAHNTQSGSFPIERIDWDFYNDGNIKTVSRYETPDTTFFTKITALSGGDPRNYAARIEFKDLGVFYPSITAYSSSTGTSDACCAMVGPIVPAPYDTDTVLKVVKSAKDLLAVDIGDSLVLFSTAGNTNSYTPTLKAPPSPVRTIVT